MYDTHVGDKCTTKCTGYSYSMCDDTDQCNRCLVWDKCVR